jgi:hypothetical protein
MIALVASMRSPMMRFRSLADRPVDMSRFRRFPPSVQVVADTVPIAVKAPQIIRTRMDGVGEIPR